MRASEPAGEILSAAKDLVFFIRFDSCTRAVFKRSVNFNPRIRDLRAKSIPFHLMQPTTIDDVCSQLLYL